MRLFALYSPLFFVCRSPHHHTLTPELCQSRGFDEGSRNRKMRLTVFERNLDSVVTDPARLVRSFTQRQCEKKRSTLGGGAFQDQVASDGAGEVAGKRESETDSRFMRILRFLCVREGAEKLFLHLR